MSIHDFNFRRPPTNYRARNISPEARALIDAAIQAGRITRVERGVSGLPAYVWCEKYRGIVTESADKAASAERRDRSNAMRAGRDRINTERAKSAQERLARAVALRAEGMTNRRIAEAMGISKWAVDDIFKQAIKRGDIQKCR